MTGVNNKHKTSKNSNFRPKNKSAVKDKNQTETKKPAEAEAKLQSIGNFSFVTGLITVIPALIIIIIGYIMSASSSYNTRLTAAYSIPITFIGYIVLLVFPFGAIMTVVTIIRMLHLRCTTGKLPFNKNLLLAITGIILYFMPIVMFMTINYAMFYIPLVLIILIIRLVSKHRA